MINTFSDVLIVILIVVGVIGAILYFLNKKMSTKMSEAQNMIAQNKQVVTIYVIDKKHDKITNVGMPKAIVDQVPKYQKMMKNYFVKAKIGPQIATLMCEKHVYNALTEKKNAKVELAGIYIVSVVGMKSKEEMKEIKKQKKKDAKNNAKNK